jgi:hypothetical protein
MPPIYLEFLLVIAGLDTEVNTCIEWVSSTQALMIREQEPRSHNILSFNIPKWNGERGQVRVANDG